MGRIKHRNFDNQKIEREILLSIWK